MDARIQHLDPLRVAFVRHLGPYQDCAPAWQQLMAWAGPRGLLTADTVCLGVGHDDPAVTDPAHLRYDACITIPAGTVVDGGVGVQDLAGGDHAVAVLRGPYDRLPAFYAALMGRWLPAQSRHLGRGSPYEIYRNDPRTTPPDELVTEVRIPLA